MHSKKIRLCKRWKLAFAHLALAPSCPGSVRRHFQPTLCGCICEPPRAFLPRMPSCLVGCERPHAPNALSAPVHPSEDSSLRPILIFCFPFEPPACVAHTPNSPLEILSTIFRSGVASSRDSYTRPSLLLKVPHDCPPSASRTLSTHPLRQYCLHPPVNPPKSYLQGTLAIVRRTSKFTVPNHRVSHLSLRQAGSEGTGVVKQHSTTLHMLHKAICSVPANSTVRHTASLATRHSVQPHPCDLIVFMQA